VKAQKITTAEGIDTLVLAYDGDDLIEGFPEVTPGRVDLDLDAGTLPPLVIENVTGPLPG
jgi:hypothetical protein